MAAESDDESSQRGVPHVAESEGQIWVQEFTRTPAQNLLSKFWGSQGGSVHLLGPTAPASANVLNTELLFGALAQINNTPIVASN